MTITDSSWLAITDTIKLEYSPSNGPFGHAYLHGTDGSVSHDDAFELVQWFAVRHASEYRYSWLSVAGSLDEREADVATRWFLARIIQAHLPGLRHLL